VLLAPYYRSYELPWEGDEESARQFRVILRAGIIILVLFTLLFIFLPAPKKTHMEESVPPRLARVMIESQPKPPPPPPKVVEEKPKPKPEEKKVAMVKPPVDRQQQAREKAQRQLNQVKDELADLREQLDMTQLAQTKNLSGAVGADSHAERNLITSKVGTGSGGITTSQAGSRGFGTGAGSLTGHETGAVASSIARSGLDARGPTRTGNSGKASRSREEIELIFDRNKGAIYSLYSRALRDTPDLQGKMVLEFTVSPTGEVTMCRVVSSELNDPELEKKIVARVRLFRFEAKDVETITTTKPIDFFPA
jgi:periplasmic protein TonB